MTSEARRSMRLRVDGKADKAVRGPRAKHLLCYLKLATEPECAVIGACSQIPVSINWPMV